MYYVVLIRQLVQTDSSKVIRRSLPRFSDMLEWGVIKAGVIIPKNRTEEAVLLDNGHVLVEGEEQSIQKWLREIFGWSSVQTYVFAMHKEKGKSLSDIREEYMNRNKVVR